MKTVNRKGSLAEAAIDAIRSKGYAATTVDDLCKSAQVTKGCFFHHFESKDALALEAVATWRSGVEELFGSASYQKEEDPLARLLGYLQLRRQLVVGPASEYTCLYGALLQETYETHPEIRLACEAGMMQHIDELALDAAKAKELYSPAASWSPLGLARHIQIVLQGSFVLAKATHNPEVVLEAIDHLETYIRFLFPHSSKG